MTGVYSITNNSTETKERIVSEDRDYLQVLTAFSRIERDFSQIYSPLFYSHRYIPTNAEKSKMLNNPETKFTPNEKYIALSNEGQPIPNIDNPDKSTLIFKSSVHKRTIQNAKQSHFAWIRYRIIPMEDKLDNNDDTPSNRKGLYQLMRSYQTEDIYKDEFDWDNSPSFVVLKNIKSFEFHFWNHNAQKFVSSLKELNQNDPLLRLIQVKLTWIDKNGSEKEFERSFRTLMPYFDTKADRDALLRAKNDGTNGQDQMGNFRTRSGNSPSTTSENDEEDD